jgi:hypothetical protein
MEGKALLTFVLKCRIKKEFKPNILVRRNEKGFAPNSFSGSLRNISYVSALIPLASS